VCAGRKAVLRYLLVQEAVRRWDERVAIGEVHKEAESEEFRFHTADCCGYAERPAYLLETRTLRHGLGDDLGELAGAMRAARNWLKGHRAYKALRSLCGADGTIRSEELTWGQQHGWHPHEHELWFCSRELAEGTRQLVQFELAELWQEACVRHGLPEPSVEHGLRLDAIEGENAAYVAKWGAAGEIALGVAKSPRHSGQSPWDLLERAGRGDRGAAALWREYAVAQKGARQLHWSRGLLDRLGLRGWKPPAVESACVYVVEAAAWRAVCRPRADWLERLFGAAAMGVDAIARVLQAAMAESGAEEHGPAG
jgi:hypothetical protein